jgi:DNA-binding response OmpR family regulator
MENPVAAGGAKTIVVIDDDEDFVSLVKMMLAETGARIVPAFGGREGLELIRQHPPDLVILDLALPDISGWEVFLQLRDDAATSETPVIILTNQGTRVDRNFSLRVAQVHDFLSKPCLPSQLRQSVASALRNSPKPAPADTANAPPVAANAPPVAANAPPVAANAPPVAANAPPVAANAPPVAPKT